MTSWIEGVERRVLANGLTVLAQYDRHAPAVAMVTHVKAGFFDEPDRWQGISHVLEHMFFKGTPTRGVGQIAAETKGLGGYLNAHTSYDATCYYVVAPADRFAAVAAIQADALRRASIDTGELARELKVIVEEAKRKLDTPSAHAYETLHELLFDRHRIRRWRIGTEAGLLGFTRADVDGYYRSRYVPDRVIVAVVGKVPTAEVFATAERLYGDWPAALGGVDPSPEEPWRSGVRARVLRGDVRQADLALGWRGVAPLAPDAAPLDVAAAVLSSGRGSWLYQTVRQPGLVSSIGAYHYSPAEVGVFSITADLAPGDLAAVVERIAGLIARLRTTGPATADLERAATLRKAQWARRLESLDGRAMAFASAEAQGGLEILDQEFARLDAVTARGVVEVAARYLAPESVSAVAFVPAAWQGDLAEPWLAATFAGSPPLSPAEPPPPAEPAPPIPRPAARTRHDDVVHASAGSVDVLIRPRPGAPLVSVGVYRRRVAEESPDTAGLGTLAIRSLMRGAGRYDANGLAHAFESLGGSLSVAVGADWVGVAASVLAERRDLAASLLVETITAPRFDPAEIERERRTLAEEAVHAADDMFRYPVQMALGGAFGPVGYGLPVKGTVASLERLGAYQVRAWHGAELAAGRTTMVAVGRVDPDRSIPSLVGAMAGFGPGREAKPLPAVPWARVAPEVVESRDKSQTAIAMAFPGPSRTDPDRHAVEVLAAIGSGLGGRLFTALRERRSLAYTVLMSSWQRARAGALISYIATSPQREDEARDAMLEELRRFGAQSVTDEELDQAVNYLAGQAIVQRQTTAAMASELVDAWLIGTGLAELTDPAAAYRAVTKQAVQAAAQRYLRSEDAVVAVVRGGR
ncbi:MAG: insulinase family protein [Gemmatimonadetes bacterium]|nr:insulinase family protein [Gemmatimonadota bacterium]